MFVQTKKIYNVYLLEALELTRKRDEEMRLKQLAMLAQDDEKIKAELNNKNS